MMVVIFLKGATAYELQIWRFGARFCHLKGGGWAKARWWNRISFQWFGREYDE